MQAENWAEEKGYVRIMYWGSVRCAVISNDPGSMRRVSHSTRKFLAVFVLVGLLAGSAMPTFARDVSLKDAVALALANNPDFSAASRELMVASGELTRANYLVQFNPNITTDADYRERTGKSNAQDWRVHLTQEFEIFGQPGLRRKSARLGYERTSANIGNEARLLIAAVKMTFYETLRARSEEQLLTELEALDHKLNGAANARLEAGEIGQIDANLARVRYGVSSRSLIEGRERYRLERSSLGRLLGEAAGPEPAPTGDLRVEPMSCNTEKLLETARLYRPDLKAAQLEIARLQTEATLNDRLALPNPTLGPYIGHENNTEHFGGMSVGFSIPLFNRRQAEGAIIAGKMVQARDRMRAAELNLEREVRDGCERYTTALAVVRVNQEDVVTPARESFGLLEEAFSAGKLDLLSLSIAERQAFEARMGDVAAWFNLVSAQISLELAVGETN
jgi:cobalt-zinc-cadmium efflux system outer membrane protein